MIRESSGGGNELRLRVISSLALGAIALAALLIGGTAFALLCGIVASLALREVASLQSPEATSFRLNLVAVAGFLPFVFLVSRPDLPGNGMMLLLAAIPVLLAALIIAAGREFTISFGFAILLAALMLAILRSSEGIALTIWVISVVVATDVSGYVVGKLVGGKKVAPAISPGKSWSGTIAGWFAALAAGVAFVDQIGFQALPLALALSVASQFGDLAASWLKRQAGVKDSSGMLPGHGGLLDRFDGMTGAGLLYFFIALVDLAPDAG